MRLTDRDVKLVKDIALSGLLSRDQILELGYFGSVTRLNTRLRGITRGEYICVLPTPFYGQHLYTAGRKAAGVVGEHVAGLLAKRSPSPRFVQHALAVTSIRIALKAKGLQGWRFEQQLWTRLAWRGTNFDVRPDGLAFLASHPIFVEADLGHVGLPKFRQKLQGYSAYLESRLFERSYGASAFDILVVTTTERRKKVLQRAVEGLRLNVTMRTFGELGAECPGGWS